MKDKIRQLRKKAHLTQTQLASLIDTTQGAVGLWESGKSLPRTDKLPKLAAALGCRISDLLE